MITVFSRKMICRTWFLNAQSTLVAAYTVIGHVALNHPWVRYQKFFFIIQLHPLWQNRELPCFVQTKMALLVTKNINSYNDATHFHCRQLSESCLSVSSVHNQKYIQQWDAVAYTSPELWHKMSAMIKWLHLIHSKRSCYSFPKDISSIYWING